MSAIILLHGALGSAEQFGKIIGQFGPGANIFTFDFAGHGKSEQEGDFSIESFSEQLKDFCSRFADYHIFGYSMGGYVALYAAGLHKINPLSIVTLGTKFAWSSDFSDKETRMLDQTILKEQAPAYFESLLDLHGDKTVKLLEGTKKLMTDLGSNPLLTPELMEKIGCKVIVCRGDRDKMVTGDESEFAVSNIKDSNYLVFENTPHPLDRIESEFLVKKLNTIFQL